MFEQLTLGALVLVICAIVHVFFIAYNVQMSIGLAKRTEKFKPMLRVSIVVGTAFLLLLFAHTVQVWIWALALLMYGALIPTGDAVYFSLVTYTSLGYGDIVLAQGHRIFGAIASVTGLLTFGVSTAYLVSLMSRILPDIFEERHK
ncbi:MAG: ion channel [Pseudoruegeria sp.]